MKEIYKKIIVRISFYNLNPLNGLKPLNMVIGVVQIMEVLMIANVLIYAMKI